MFYLYKSYIGSQPILRNIIVDDDLLKGEYGFLFKEIISDFSLKQVNDVFNEYQTSVFASGYEFLKKNHEIIFNLTEKKIFVFGDLPDNMPILRNGVQLFSDDEIPLSFNEWREKIINNSRVIVVKKTIIVDLITSFFEKLLLPKKIKKKILSKIPMTIKKLEHEIAKDIPILDFNKIRVIGANNISMKLLYKCLLSGVEIEGYTLSKEQLEMELADAYSQFKNKILRYV
ncbi:hypothetical protein [Marinomonas primoryensis]|uniref:Uncharacterized protein n=1 Tax=Marinomonas primoryensis TaxID=178399 RepID=A0A859CZ53_9GAMM|nr:hypothetical protein [Marinomonas primoryensis]QKK81965.1 uncharacterized protein MP3633_3238 [Marinomonas primoryensis]